MPIRLAFHMNFKIRSISISRVVVLALGVLAVHLCSHAAITNVAWYRLGDNDPAAASGQVVKTTTVDFIGSNDLRRVGTGRYTNHVSSDAAQIGSTLAASFAGGGFYSTPEVIAARNNFGIEAWVGLLNSSLGVTMIAYNGNNAANGWGLSLAVTNDPFLGPVVAFVGELGGNNRIVSHLPRRPAQWTHVALVRDNGRSTLYVNGVASGSTSTFTPAAATSGFAIAATLTTPASGFYTGLIDEVRVFTFAPGQFSTDDLLVNQPMASTLSPTGLAPTRATLNGSSHSLGYPIAAWFQWGDSPALGHFTPAQQLGSGLSETAFSQVLTGLSPGVSYYFRAAASNELGEAFGSVTSFVIGPSVETRSATAVQETKATLQGMVNPNGTTARAWFEWGTTTNYGNVTPKQSFNDTGDFEFSQSLAGLSGTTTYHFRAVASNNLNVVLGTNQSFTTPAQSTISFEEFPTGTLVGETYASMGVHFVNDFRPTGGTHAAPRIMAHGPAPSPGNVLVNFANDYEITTSSRVPLVFWFDQPQTSVSMFLGAYAAGGAPSGCGGPYPATISFRDCAGQLLSQLFTNVNTSFNTFASYTNSAGRIRRVDVDYGAITCSEAIDTLTFRAGTGNTPCTDATAPIIAITSHTNDQFVIDPQQVISGHIMEPGIVRSVTLNGLPILFYLSGDGRNYFDGPVTLVEGNNTITVVAENASGKKATAQLRLFLGTPVSARLKAFHLTQRGVMKDEPCDIDTPLVAGKTTVVRVNLEVLTANGLPTYASSVKLKVWRVPASGPDQLVGTFFGNSYAPFLTTLNSPSDLAAVLFWLPGYARPFDVPGDYRFTVEAYVGSTLIGPALIPCGGQSSRFHETKPVRLLILPVQYGRLDSIFNDTNHLKNYYMQLDTIARSYPVRDGIGNLGTTNRGLIFHELLPLLLCDGPATEGLDHCAGTDWTWDFFEKHPSGLLRRGENLPVRATTTENFCNTNNLVGGRISAETSTHSYNPSRGVFRVEARPLFDKDKHAIPQDEDHDGDVDAADLAFYAAEFFDDDTGTWTTDFSLYDFGETFRFFRDQNGNFCMDPAEPRSLVMQRSINHQTLLYNPAQRALDVVNKTNSADTAFRSASLWFPASMIPPSVFGATGPGQGNKPGRLSWIHVTGNVTMAHELGHNFNLPDLYHDQVRDDLVTMENAWAVYINGVSQPPEKVIDIMGASFKPETAAFSKSHYQTIFDQLQVPHSAAAAAPGPGPAPASASASPAASRQMIQFIITGFVYDDGHLDKVVPSLGRGHELSPQLPDSPYALVFGAGTAILDSVNFGLEPHPETHFDELPGPAPYQTFRVVANFPPTTEWVELQKDNQVLTRINRPASAPVVTVLTPNGGESFGVDESVAIQWTIAGPDRPELRASVYYSPDRGTNWLLLVAATRMHGFTWNTASWPGTSNGLIRVVISDGFNEREDQSDNPFTVARKPPRVSILQPQNGETIMQCARPLVRGTAEDLEGPIRGAQWMVDSNLSATEFEAQLEALSPGRHVLRLEVRDADNQLSFDEVTVEIVADSDCDGLSDEFEAAHGLNPGSINDATSDGDDDGLTNFDELIYGTSPSDPDTDDDLYLDGMELEAGSNPLDPLDTPFDLVPTRIVSIECVDGTVLRIKVDPEDNRAAYEAGLTQFELQQSTDFQNWTTVAFPSPVRSGLVIFETPCSGPTRFYRVATVRTNP